MSKHRLHRIMRAEVKADCYAGETCDQVRNHFEIYCDGDMQAYTSREDLKIRLADLPAGAVVEVSYPCCPSCGAPRMDKFKSARGGAMRIVGHAEKCDCGFDWQEWVLNEYS